MNMRSSLACRIRSRRRPSRHSDLGRYSGGIAMPLRDPRLSGTSWVRSDRAVQGPRERCLVWAHVRARLCIFTMYNVLPWVEQRVECGDRALSLTAAAIRPHIRRFIQIPIVPPRPRGSLPSAACLRPDLRGMCTMGISPGLEASCRRPCYKVCPGPPTYVYLRTPPCLPDTKLIGMSVLHLLKY